MKAKPGRNVLGVIASDKPGRLKNLLDAGLSPNAVIRFDPGGRLSYTLLEIAADKGAEKAAALLIKAGANVNAGKRKPLILAAAKSYLKIVKLLLDAGADPNVKGNDDDTKDRGLTPLMYAIWPPYNPKLLELLLARGADPQVVTKKGNTALSRAIAYGNPQAAKRLLKMGCKADGTLLSRPVYSGELDLLRLFIAAGADVNVRGSKAQWENAGGTLLQTAMEQRVNSVENLQNSPIVFRVRPSPARRRRIEKNLKAKAHLYFTILQELIRAGADPNNFVGSVSPLYWAVEAEDLETVKLLLKAGADPNRAQDLPRDMTLQEACRKGFVECCMPLHEACRNGFVEIVECLLIAGADVKMLNDKGRTVLEELRQVTKSHELEILGKSIQLGHQKADPGMVETKYKAWNKNRARLIQILEKIPGSERRGAFTLKVKTVDDVR